MRADDRGERSLVAVDLQRPWNTVIGRDNDRSSSLRVREIAVYRLDLVGNVVPSHAVREKLVLGVETERVNPVRRRDGKR
jgi:hypothetical protein